jgi:hypothetical protein
MMQLIQVTTRMTCMNSGNSAPRVPPRAPRDIHRGDGVRWGCKRVGQISPVISTIEALTPVMTSEVACYRVTDAHHLDWIEPAGSAHTATLTRIFNGFQRHLTVETAGPILMTT